jgi:translation elongation factor EF-Tu-like GTPase
MTDLIIVKAKIKVLTTEDGGKRINGFKSGYRPNHFFEVQDGVFKTGFMGDIVFSEQELIYPGDEKIVTVRFIKYEPILKFMQVGREWFINEANNRIAIGEILEIVSM